MRNTGNPIQEDPRCASEHDPRLNRRSAGRRIELLTPNPPDCVIISTQPINNDPPNDDDDDDDDDDFSYTRPSRIDSSVHQFYESLLSVGDEPPHFPCPQSFGQLSRTEDSNCVMNIPSTSRHGFRTKLDAFLSERKEIVFRNLSQDQMPKLESRSEEIANDGSYGVGPTLDLYMGLDIVERTREFYRSVKPGDVILAQVHSQSHDGMTLKLLSFDGPKRAFLEDLDLMEPCSTADMIPKSISDPTQTYQMDDKVRCEVLRICYTTREIKLGMKGVQASPEFLSGFPLGWVRDSDVPPQYLCARQRWKFNKRNTYDDAMSANSHFSTSDISTLASYLGVYSNCNSLFHGLGGMYAPESMLSGIQEQLHFKLTRGNLNQGFESLRRNDPDKALRSFCKVLVIQSENLPALIARGMICADREMWDQAQKDLELAVRLKPELAGQRMDLASALLKTGSGLQRKGDNASALACYEDCLAIIPEEEATLELLMRLHEQIEKFSTPLVGLLMTKLDGIQCGLKQMIAEEILKDESGFYRKKSEEIPTGLHSEQVSSREEGEIMTPSPELDSFGKMETPVPSVEAILSGSSTPVSSIPPPASPEPEEESPSHRSSSRDSKPKMKKKRTKSRSTSRKSSPSSKLDKRRKKKRRESLVEDQVSQYLKEFERETVSRLLPEESVLITIAQPGRSGVGRTPERKVEILPVSPDSPEKTNQILEKSAREGQDDVAEQKRLCFTIKQAVVAPRIPVVFSSPSSSSVSDGPSILQNKNSGLVKWKPIVGVDVKGSNSDISAHSHSSLQLSPSNTPQKANIPNDNRESALRRMRRAPPETPRSPSPIPAVMEILEYTSKLARSNPRFSHNPRRNRIEPNSPPAPQSHGIVHHEREMSRSPLRSAPSRAPPQKPRSCYSSSENSSPSRHLPRPGPPDPPYSKSVSNHSSRWRSPEQGSRSGAVTSKYASGCMRRAAGQYVHETVGRAEHHEHAQGHHRRARSSSRHSRSSSYDSAHGSSSGAPHRHRSRRSVLRHGSRESSYSPPRRIRRERVLSSNELPQKHSPIRPPSPEHSQKYTKRYSHSGSRSPRPGPRGESRHYRYRRESREPSYSRSPERRRSRSTSYRRSPSEYGQRDVGRRGSRHRSYSRSPERRRSRSTSSRRSPSEYGRRDLGRRGSRHRSYSRSPERRRSRSTSPRRSPNEYGQRDVDRRGSRHRSYSWSPGRRRSRSASSSRSRSRRKSRERSHRSRSPSSHATAEHPHWLRKHVRYNPNYVSPNYRGRNPIPHFIRVQLPPKISQHSPPLPRSRTSSPGSSRHD